MPSQSSRHLLHQLSGVDTAIGDYDIDEAQDATEGSEVVKGPLLDDMRVAILVLVGFEP
jgi:hypothetical protein